MRLAHSFRNEALVLALRRGALRAELCQHPVDGEKGWHRSASGRGAIARPAIAVRLAGDLGAHRVKYHVAAQFEEIGIAIDQDRLEATLQHVTDPAVATVEPLRVDTVELAHGLRKTGLPGLEEEVIVVVHQAVGVHGQVKARDNTFQNAQEALPVLVVEEDVLPRAVR